MLNRTGPFQVVRTYDPAIDREDSSGTDWRRFYDDRDPSLLRYLPGQLPVVFHCRPLTVSECREVKARQGVGGASSPQSREIAFQLGLVRVERLAQESGRRDWTYPDDGSGKRKPLSDDALALFGQRAIEEIGGVIEARSFLDPDLPLFVPLLATSLLAQKALESRPAAPTSASSASTGDRPAAAASAETQLGTPDASLSGGAPGAATATASPTPAPPT